MEDMQVGLLAFLGVLELAMVALLAAAVFVLRSRRLARRARALEKRLASLSEVPEPVGFDQYLHDEIVRNQGLIDEAAASDDAAENKAAELLEFRKRFLELELEARELENNPVAFQDRLSAGLCELREQMRPEPVHVEAEAEPEADASEELEEAPDDEPQEERKVIDTSEEEINHLKTVINNQQDAMAALRARIEEYAHDVEGMDTVLRQLDDFEKQSAELERCLLVLESENERLKAASQEGQPGGAQVAEADPAQLTGLRNMVGSQQETIDSLRGMISELLPEADKASGLQEVLDGIQRTNQELSGCVSVLEDENAMLRSELEMITRQLEEQEAAAEAQTVEEAADTADNNSEQIRELEIKVQELEALVEFKDATIEELEKQYNVLEAKYREVTGGDEETA